MNVIALIIGWSGAVGVTTAGSLWYFHHVRLPRPAIGVYDGSDLFILLVAIIVLPFLYLALPTSIFAVVFFLGVLSSLFIGLQPWLSTRHAWVIVLWLAAIGGISSIPLLANNPLGRLLHGFIADVLLCAMAIVIANTYAQGGLRLRPLAWGMLVLAVYDAVFAWVLPLTPLLFTHFAQAPLAPIVRIPLGPFQTCIGLGDLLAFATYSTVAYKSFGRRGFVVSVGLIACFGILLPAVCGWWLSITTPQLARVFPLQVSFGPAAFVAYWWLAHVPERTVGAWQIQQQGEQQRPDTSLAADSAASARS